MSEPISGAAAGAAGIKLLGGGTAVMSAFAALGAALAALVVMCLTTPRNPKEWAVGMISTVVGSFGGGCAVIMHYDLLSWGSSPVGLVALLGLAFTCGLPGWAIVRWTFNYIIKNQAATITDVAADAKKLVP